MRPFSAKQLEQMQGQRLNGRERRLVETCLISLSERARLADEVRRLERAMHYRETRTTAREKVLVTIEGDGTVKVHAADHVDARVVALARVPCWHDALMSKAEEIAAYQLPGIYRDLWQQFPKPRAVGSVKDCRTPAELYHQSEEQARLAELDNIIARLT